MLNKKRTKWCKICPYSFKYIFVSYLKIDCFASSKKNTKINPNDMFEITFIIFFCLKKMFMFQLYHTKSPIFPKIKNWIKTVINLSIMYKNREQHFEFIIYTGHFNLTKYLEKSLFLPMSRLICNHISILV